MPSQTHHRTATRRSSRSKVERILAEAARVLRDDPQALTTGRVARASGVTPSYISTYIGPVEELKAALVKRHLQRLESLQAEAAEAVQAYTDDPIGGLALLLAHILGRQAPDLVDEATHFEICRLAAEQGQAFGTPWARSLGRLFKEGLAQVAPTERRDQVSQDRAGRAAAWACLGLLFGYATRRPLEGYTSHDLYMDMARVSLSLLDRDPTSSIAAFESLEAGEIPLS